MKYICFFSPSGKPMYERVNGRFARDMRMMYNCGIVDFNRIVNTENKARRWKISYKNGLRQSK